MKFYNVIGYAFDADTHCIECTCELADVGILKREPPLKIGTDENGIALDLIDSEGNLVHPIFAGYESADENYCGDCGEKLL